MQARLYVALTTELGDGLLPLAEELAGVDGVGVKVGLELYLSRGREAVRRLVSLGLPVFLDLKFCDIPHTVAGAVRAVAPLRPEMVNVHATGGRSMMRAAVEAAEGRFSVIAVTVLTSLDGSDLGAMSIDASPGRLALSLAEAAAEEGMDGVVCSPREAAAVRSACGDGFRIVTPGIRPEGWERGDQKRVATPREAVSAGATSLVVGRPVTRSDSPADAARAILEQMSGASGNG
jgi:orotidine-5'-phosphate decarboxylase